MTLRVVLLALLTLSSTTQSAELRLQLGSVSRIWSSAELLAHPQARHIEIAEDVSYKRAMSYRAVPLAALQEAGDRRIEGLRQMMPGARIESVLIGNSDGA